MFMCDERKLFIANEEWGTGKEEKRSVERYSGEKVQQQNKQRRIAIVAFLNHLRENEQQQLQQHHHHHRQ